ncbi:MAG: sn-glycerol-3-phosphate ABC transporter ATP-binding protein UgpC [Rubrivivax sp.]|jgi:multiple sugar transport system ATP-binding protein|nr:sn-glycerol-3-phosphate ABC transporter ATP-binding protein UgpC [Rubrivivax sp.]
MASITLDHIGKSYTAGVTVIRDLSFEIKDGEFMVFVGPSGCGKSTVLRMIAGLETVTSGTLKIGDRVVNDVHPKDRDIAMVFQSYALYPHMTVYDNIAFGLQIRKIPEAEIKKRVQEAADTLGLNAYLDRKPKALSGGQRQRVALGRAIVRNPSVFLFDEPLSNLDAELRVHMRAELSKLQRRLKTTTVYVTHDQVEAMTMGHRIAVLRPCGTDPNVTNLTQIGTPMEIYDTPANLFTAGFMGTPKMNLLKAKITDDGHDVVFYGVRMPVSPAFGAAAQRHKGRDVILGIRPEHIGAAHEVDWKSDCSISGTIEILEPLGHEVIVHFQVQGETVSGRLRSHVALPRPGDPISLQVRTEAMHLFDPSTEKRLAA